MRNIYKINDELSVEEVVKKNKTIMLLIRNGKKTVLCNMKTWDSFFCKLAYDDSYIVVYSRGTMINQISLNVEVAYSIKNGKFVNLKNKRLQTTLEYMLISRKGFDLTEVLTTINDSELGLVEADEKDDLTGYLTAGSFKVSREEVVKYILKAYPELKQYTNLSGPISVIGYKRIVEEIGNETFWFNVMPLDLELVPPPKINPAHPDAKNYEQIYI